MHFPWLLMCGIITWTESTSKLLQRTWGTCEKNELGLASCVNSLNVLLNDQLVESRVFVEDVQVSKKAKPPEGALEESGAADTTSENKRVRESVDEDIPSFEEWRQRRLQDVAKEKSDHAVAANNTEKRRQRGMQNTNTNYASVICGAKVTAHNPELENPSAILTANRDDYMLNPCKIARKYFVVELCESVHIYGFDIGNLELFSNVPKIIQVFGSARYPSRDWTDFGKFELTETRTMQNFTVPPGTGFIKFVRVEMLEHYGKEHYCPITVFRVFGTSMVEEYVDSVDDDDDEDRSAQIHVDGITTGTSTQTEDAYMEKDKWGPGLLETNINPITMAKDLVVSFVRKAASSGYNLINGASQNSTPAPCRNTTAVITSLRANASESHNITHTSSDIAPNSPLLSLCFDNVDGWDVATVTCQYVWCLFQASNASLSFCPGIGNASANFDTVNIQTRAGCDPQPEDIVERGSMTESERSIPAAHETVVENVSTIGEVIHPLKLPLEETIPTADPKASKFVSANDKEQHRSLATELPPVVHSKVEYNSASQSEKSVPVIVVNNIVTETSTLAVPVPSITNGVPGQKESVFVRLGNRLKTLELNMSLSGQYLHELSRRFKKQGEDSARNFTAVFARILELTQTESSLHTTLLGRMRELDSRNRHLEAQSITMQNELRILRWVVPVLCVISVLLIMISVAVGLYMVPRYIRRLVLMEAQRQHVHGQTNGHAVNSLLSHEPIISSSSDHDMKIHKKKHKKHKKHHESAVLISFDDIAPRLVPESIY